MHDDYYRIKIGYLVVVPDAYLNTGKGKSFGEACSQGLAGYQTKAYSEMDVKQIWNVVSLDRSQIGERDRFGVAMRRI